MYLCTYGQKSFNKFIKRHFLSKIPKLLNFKLLINEKTHGYPFSDDSKKDYERDYNFQKT